MTEVSAKRDLLRDAFGHEWLILADEVGQVQLDITHGTLTEGPVLLHFDVTGFRTFSAKLKTLARLEALHRIGRFPRALFPPETGTAKWARALQAYDGMCAGASHREIGAALFGEKRVREEWNGRSDYLHSQVRRLLIYARKMVDGGYKSLLQ